jgi:hypothetical protein
VASKLDDPEKKIRHARGHRKILEGVDQVAIGKERNASPISRDVGPTNPCLE